MAHHASQKTIHYIEDKAYMTVLQETTKKYAIH